MWPTLTGIQFGTIQGWVIVFKFPFSSDITFIILPDAISFSKNKKTKTPIVLMITPEKRRKKVKLARDFCEECKKRFLKKAHLFCWELYWLWIGQNILQFEFGSNKHGWITLPLKCRMNWSFSLRGEDRKVRRVRKVQEADIKLSCFLLLWYKYPFTLHIHIHICLCECFNCH